MKINHYQLTITSSHAEMGEGIFFVIRTVY